MYRFVPISGTRVADVVTMIEYDTALDDKASRRKIYRSEVNDKNLKIRSQIDPSRFNSSAEFQLTKYTQNKDIRTNWLSKEYAKVLKKNK